MDVQSAVQAVESLRKDKIMLKLNHPKRPQNGAKGVEDEDDIGCEGHLDEIKKLSGEVECVRLKNGKLEEEIFELNIKCSDLEADLGKFASIEVAYEIQG